jgi:hypothetical protein
MFPVNLPEHVFGGAALADDGRLIGNVSLEEYPFFIV